MVLPSCGNLENRQTRRTGVSYQAQTKLYRNQGNPLTETEMWLSHSHKDIYKKIHNVCTAHHREAVRTLTDRLYTPVLDKNSLTFQIMIVMHIRVNVITLPKWRRNSLVGTVTRLRQAWPGNRSSSKQMPGQYLKSGHGRFLPHTFQFPFLPSSNHSAEKFTVNDSDVKRTKKYTKITHPLVSSSTPPSPKSQPVLFPIS